jgi:uncharacterized protein
MSRNASFWIEQLNLSKHIEGGSFSEVYKSELKLSASQLPEHFSSTTGRHLCTHIYFLLEKEQFSALHRIQSDELWHFYAGDSLIIYEIETSGNLVTHVLGTDPEKNQQLFTYVKAGSWFGAALPADSGFALVGCTVSPGFDYDDFEMADRETLAHQYPRHCALIKSLTR